MEKFKPVFGKTYKDNSSASKKYYEDLNKQLEAYSGQIKSLSELMDFKGYDDANIDWNKNVLDLEYTNEPSEEFKRRVRLNVLGFNSPQEYERKAIKNGKEVLPEEYQANLSIYNSLADKAKIRGEEVTSRRHSGLKARMEKREKFKPRYSYVKEGKDRVFKFANDVFLTKETALENLPKEIHLKEGRHIVEDANGTKFIFESTKYDGFNYCKVDFVAKVNDNQVNEQLNRIKELYAFSSKPLGHGLSKGGENAMINESINVIRGLCD